MLHFKVRLIGSKVEMMHNISTMLYGFFFRTLYLLYSVLLYCVISAVSLLVIAAVRIFQDSPLFLGWVLSWISQCPGFVLDLKSSDFWVTLHWKMHIVHPAGWKTARNLVSWFSAKSLKLLPPDLSDFKAKMHQIRFRLGLRPRPRWGSLQRFPSL